MIEVHAYIDVAELERGIAFYCNGLGLALKRRLSASWVELAGANLPIFLLGNRSPTAQLGGTQIRRDFGRHWTPVHLDFIVPDIGAADRARRRPRPADPGRRLRPHGEHGRPVRQWLRSDRILRCGLRRRLAVRPAPV